MTLPELAKLLEATQLDYDDPDCEHFECGHVVQAERANAELRRHVPHLIAVATAAQAWRDAQERWQSWRDKNIDGSLLEQRLDADIEKAGDDMFKALDAFGAET